MKPHRTRCFATLMSGLSIAIACVGCARETKTVTKTTTETPEQKTVTKDVHKERVIDK
jgi:hypothetical protein